MPSFRSAASQAKHLVIKKVSHGKPRHLAKGTGEAYIASIGTELTYRYKLAQFIVWLNENRLDPKRVTPEIAQRFLQNKAETVVQSTLDGYRNAIQMAMALKLEYIVSKRVTQVVPRAYRNDQIELLIQHASPALSLSASIAAHAGLRAIELDTIARVSEMREDKRPWLPERFYGRGGETAYIVTGKGGLRRTVLLSAKLSEALEQNRLPAVIVKRQRGINYSKRYAIIGGHSFSQQFSRLSKSALGWSAGAHGLRHAYAQQRMRFLQLAGFDYKDALQIVAQELGHFSTTNTSTYLR